MILQEVKIRKVGVHETAISFVLTNYTQTFWGYSNHAKYILLWQIRFHDSDFNGRKLSFRQCAH